MVVAGPLTLSRADTFTTTANGTTVNHAGMAFKYFTVLVKGTGAAATTWDVRLEGSLDGTNFTQIIQHTNTDGDGVNKPATLPTVYNYFRSRCAGLVLGTATNIIVTILGSN